MPNPLKIITTTVRNKPNVPLDFILGELPEIRNKELGPFAHLLDNPFLNQSRLSAACPQIGDIFEHYPKLKTWRSARTETDPQFLVINETNRFKNTTEASHQYDKEWHIVGCRPWLSNLIRYNSSPQADGKPRCLTLSALLPHTRRPGGYVPADPYDGTGQLPILESFVAHLLSHHDIRRVREETDNLTTTSLLLHQLIKMHLSGGQDLCIIIYSPESYYDEKDMRFLFAILIETAGVIARGRWNHNGHGTLRVMFAGPGAAHLANRYTFGEGSNGIPKAYIIPRSEVQCKIVDI